MTKLFAALALALVLPLSTFAASTWTTDTSQDTSKVRVVKVACTTGSESAPANPVKASQTITLATTVAGNTVTIDGYTFTAHATQNGGRFFQVLGTDALTAPNLVDAINRVTGMRVVATNVGAIVTVTARDYGTAYNSIALTKVGGITLGAATLASGTEAVGLALLDLKAVSITAEAAAAMTAGGLLKVYLLNPITSRWASAPGLDIAVSALQYESYPGFEVPGDWSRIALVPSGVGQAVDIYLTGRLAPGTLR